MTAVDPQRRLGDGDDDRLVSVDEFVDEGQRGHLPRSVVGWLTTTDHKALGIAYIITSMVFLAIGGLLAGIIRAELAEPGIQIVSEQTYNGVFTIHGSVMVYLFAVPFGFGLANYLVPLQIGAPDLAFPRLNAFSYWLYVIGGAVMILGFVSDGGAAAFGWFAYPPLSGMSGSPGLGADLWIISIILTGTSGTLTAVNVISHRHHDASPGMTLFRMPILTWNMLHHRVHGAAGVPGAVRCAADAGSRSTVRHQLLRAGRAAASPILWQHLFWFFGHPEVYIVAPAVLRCGHRDLPGVLPASRCSGTRASCWRPLAIGALSTSVWAHHMFVTGSVVLPFFTLTIVADRRADRREGLQLDRHDVGGLAQFRGADEVLDRVPRHLRGRRHHRRHAGVAAARLPPVAIRTSSSGTSTTSWAGPWCSRCSPRSTSGGRR